MDSSFSTGGVGSRVGPSGRPTQNIVFGKAAAVGKAGPAPSTQPQKGARQSVQPYNASSTGQNVSNRRGSPTRMRKGVEVGAQPLSKQQPAGGTINDAELAREAKAKARRLLRFAQGQEPTDPGLQTSSERPISKTEDRFSSRETRQLKPDVSTLRSEAPKSQASALDNSQDDTMESEGAEAVGDDSNDREAIVGTCNDMCSETERLERERKGDLDKFERVDGDRNLTSIDLAVKKYTRTPSREPHMIRPLPVLQMTMDHLLMLINRGYGEELLSIHSFLWDRMRAVRMDLRMQHIFNREAITMHEQMIRFHILAMHELCQFKKGEGFNEGFDAHLNIEQMNKASVDLFEMYDDHRKRGIQVDTEAEFRGYYALLKLDKHPGYSVEPAELSLDLAKMTPEMRSTPQVLFARDVARACRGGNYIAFFRLARKATYLQACLMHAHFAKLRTEALASLHSGVQKNQGVPITLLVKWLGMEGEDIESLVEYHGFALKTFEKLYAVKDGPFLNRDAEYQARRSRLVEGKHSHTIVADVEGKGQEQPVAENWAAAVLTPVIQEEEMPDYEEEEVPSPGDVPHTSPVNEYWTTTPGRNALGKSQMPDDMRISPPFKAVPPKAGQPFPFSPNSYGIKTPPLWPNLQQTNTGSTFFLESSSPQRGRKRESYPGRLTQNIDLKEGNKKLVTELGPIDVEPEEEEDHVAASGPTREENRAQKMLEWEVEKEAEQEKERELERRKRATEEAEAAAAKWAAKLAAAAEAKRLQQEEQRLATFRAEASAGKKRQWLRRWKRRAAIIAKEKLQRRMRAEAALSSLSAGPPLAGPQVNNDTASVVNANSERAVTTIDQVAKERAERLQEMWNPLDVASLVLLLFEHRFPSSKFITFKLILSVGDTGASNIAGQWLSSKLSRNQLVLPDVHPDGCTPGFWFQVKDMDESRKSHLQNPSYGASGLIFLVRKGRPISEERARLHSVVESLPVGGRLPLLLLYTPQERQIEAETEKLKISLGLTDFEGLRIGWQNVSPVSSSFEGGLFSDGFLRGGLVWLANSAPAQPNLRSVHVRELVTSNLNVHWKLLMASAPSNVTPERCITIFNRAVRSAAMEIRKAVGTAPPHWPPPEAQPKVNEVMPGILPRLGWNEPDVLDPIFHALRVTELPKFPSTEQPRPGSPTSAWESVQYQKAAVERALQRYLALLDGTSDDNPVNVRQSQLMVRRNSSLEWAEAGRVLVPRWANIFQALYQTRLLLLNSEPPPAVYVLAKGDEDVERQLELDEVEQKIPFANDIAAGSPFGMTRRVNLMFDDMEEQKLRATELEKLSLVNAYKDQLHLQESGITIPVATKQSLSVNYAKEGTPSLLRENSWSISSPLLNSWQRDAQPFLLKKRRLALSPDTVTHSLPTNLSHSFPSPTIWTQPNSAGSIQVMGSDALSLLEGDDDSYQIHRLFEIPRTAEEIKLDDMVTKLNQDVDRVMRRASSDMCFADTQFAADLYAGKATNPVDDFCSEAYAPQDLQVAIGENGQPNSPTGSISSGMQDVDHLLERCWTAQKSIDRKLRDTFGVFSGSLDSRYT